MSFVVYWLWLLGLLGVIPLLCLGCGFFVRLLLMISPSGRRLLLFVVGLGGAHHSEQNRVLARSLSMFVMMPNLERDRVPFGF